MYIFDRAKTPGFKSDGVNWVKKSNQQRVNETFNKMNLHGRHYLTGFYAASADNYVNILFYFINIHLQTTYSIEF